MAYRIYHLPPEAPKNNSYDIHIENEPVQAHAARVSAMPFNRHWPGHQRSLDQTEVVPFVSFELDAPAAFCVVAGKDFQEAVVRPASRGVKPVCRGREIRFTLPGPGQYTLELDGVKGALHIFANPLQQPAVQPGDPDTLYFGPGIHRAGVIDMHSGQTVYIDAEAVVYGQIQAIDAENIRILGRGILDHSQEGATGPAPELSENKELIDPPRPSPLLLSYCRGVTIEGITIRDPAFLALRPIACESVSIDNVKIIGCWRYNADGIDFINSRHCRVRNCFVRTFDDSLCLKGFYFLHQGEMFHRHQAYTVMDDVIFEHCVVWNEWGKSLEVGVDLCAMEIKNCAFRNCDVIHCSGSMIMDVSNVDYAEIHDILFEDIRVEYDPVLQRPAIQESEEQTFPTDPNSTYMPELFHALICFSPYSHGGTVRGKIHDITFRNIQVTAVRLPPSHFRGYDNEHRVEAVRIENFTLNGQRIGSLEEAGLQAGPFTDKIAMI